MLSKIVVDLYSVLLEVGLWVFLIAGAVIGGWMPHGFFLTIIGAVIGVLFAGIFGATFFGAFLVLDDIRKKVKAIEGKQQA